MHPHRAIAVALLLLVLPSLPAVAAGFIALDLPGSQLTALADDGQSAAGSLADTHNGGFRWRRDHGARVLAGAVSVCGMSSSGQRVFGTSLDHNASEVPTWWDQDGVAHALDAGARDPSREAGDTPDFAAARCMNTASDFSPGDSRGIAYAAASRDGSLRVGHAGSGSARRAVIWTSRLGMQRLDVFLAAHGVEVPGAWTLVAATAVDPLGCRIGGYGLHQHRFDSFIAELPANARIPCDLLTPPTASQRRKTRQEISP